MKYNPYDPTVANSKPDPTKNVWRGNPSPPNDNTFRTIRRPESFVVYYRSVADSRLCDQLLLGRPDTANVVPLNWPDSGHRFQSGRSAAI